MKNKYIFLQEFIRSPINAKNRVLCNYWREDCNPIHHKEYTAWLCINNTRNSFNKIKRFL